MITRLNLNDYTKYDFNTLNCYNVDWTKEPKESLRELYKQHAQYIRDNYDYIIIYYSGGADSTTVLNSFLDNDIFVNEVVTTTFDKVDVPCFDSIYALNHLKSKRFTGIFSNPVITLNSISTFMKSDNILSDSQYYKGTIHSLSRLNVENLEKFGCIQSKNRIGRIAHVYGAESPVVSKIDNHYYITHSLSRDLFIKSYGIENTIQFFSSKEFPKVYVKQAHIIAKAMKILNVSVLPIEIINKLIRDDYNPIISPPKSNGMNFLNSPNKNTEASILFNIYGKENTFKDLYINAVMLHQYKIEEKLKNINKQTLKYDLLF